MKPFWEKYPNFISPRKCQAIKLSERSWMYRGHELDFKRHFILAMRDEYNFVHWNGNTNKIISNILKRFYNQHL
jgi:hypothetical protein